MSCTPGIGIDANGQEFADLENVSFGHTPGYESDADGFSLNESTGEVTYNAIEDPTAPQEQTFSEKEYFDTLAQVYPIEQMHAYVKATSSNEDYDSFNAVLQQGSFEEVNQVLEAVFEDLQQADWSEQAAQPQEDSAPAGEVADLTPEQVEHIQELYPVEELQGFLRESFNEDVIAQFDQIVEYGSFEQVKGLYDMLYDAYQENA